MLKPGDIVDDEKRFAYVCEAEPSKAGNRRITVREINTGEEITGTYYCVIHNKISTASERKQGYQNSGIKRSKYKEGDIIGKYNNILIISLDQELYPSHVRSDGKTDRRGLFRDLDTNEEFIGILNRVIYSPGSKKVISHGEQAVASVLDKLNIKHKSQKAFDDLLGFSRRKPCFDFYLPDFNLLIEYDGAQHLIKYENDKDNTYYNNLNDEDFYLPWARDVIKEAWCSKNDVILLRIAALPPNNINETTLSKMIDNAQKHYKKTNETLYVYPENNVNLYESVKTIMSNLPFEEQKTFSRRLTHLNPTYRRKTDLPVNEDKELLMAIPNDYNVEPILFAEPIEPTLREKKKGVYKEGDVVGPNGVIFVSEYINGKLIEPQNKKRQGLFQCSCEKHTQFIATFSSVLGGKGYNGKICDECTSKRRKELLKNLPKQHREPIKNEYIYKQGDILDKNGKFAFHSEINDTNIDITNRFRMVNFTDTDNPDAVRQAKLSSLRSGKIKTIKEQLERKEKRRQRKLNKGDIIGVENNLIVQEDIEYTNATMKDKTVRVYNTDTNKEYQVKLPTALYSKTTGIYAGYIIGTKIDDTELVLLDWCDKEGNTTELQEGCSVGEYAKFQCDCEDKTIFVAKWNLVMHGHKSRCPKCMEKRAKEARRKNGLSRKLIFEPGVDTVDPDGIYLYIGEDTESKTKKRKIIIRNKETGEEFSYRFDEARQGNITPPSQAEKNKQQMYETNQQYKIGTVISAKNSLFCIIGETEPVINSCGNPVRNFVFQNIQKEKIFDSTMQPVKSGLVTGARSKKTRDDYPGVSLLIDEEVKALVENFEQNPEKPKKKTQKAIINEVGVEKIQEMLNEGLSSSKIGEKVGVSFQTVCQFIKDNNLTNSCTNDARKIDITDAPIEKIKQMLKEGLTMTEIGRVLGYKYAYMRKVMDKIESETN